MKLKSLRNTLIATAAIAGTAGLGIGIWAILGRGVDSPFVAVPPTLPETGSVSPATTSIDTSLLDRLKNLSLQPKRSTQRIEQPSVAMAGPGFGISLVGTMIDSSQTLALFRDKRGAFDLKGVGQSLDLLPAGVQVAQIEPGIVKVQFEGRDITLPLDGVNPANAASSMPSQPTPSQPMPTQPSAGMSTYEPGPEMPTEPDPGSMMMGRDETEPAISPGESIFDMFPQLDPTRPQSPAMPGTPSDPQL